MGTCLINNLEPRFTRNNAQWLRRALCVDGVTREGIEDLSELFDLNNNLEHLTERTMPTSVASRILRNWLRIEKEFNKLSSGGEPDWAQVNVAIRFSLKSLLDWASDEEE